MPICRTCNKEKSINNFYKEARNKSKVRNECKSCFKIKYDARYHAKRDEILEKGRQRNREFKTEVMQHYGGKCDCCGIDVLEFLSIDPPPARAACALPSSTLPMSAAPPATSSISIRAS